MKNVETDSFVALVELLRTLNEGQDEALEFEDTTRLYLIDREGRKILL